MLFFNIETMRASHVTIYHLNVPKPEIKQSCAHGYETAAALTSPFVWMFEASYRAKHHADCCSALSWAPPDPLNTSTRWTHGFIGL